MGLLIVGFLAGVVAGVSPCILPVVPVLFVGWTVPVEGQSSPQLARRQRAVSVALGLVLSFSLVTALGAITLSSLGLPDALFRDIGLVMLVLVGLGLMVPRVEEWLEQPFRRLTRAAPSSRRSGFVLGLALGLVFVPCAGPVLATVSVLGSTHHPNITSVLLSFFFALGAALPLLSLALAGDALIERTRIMSRHSRRWRPVAGGLLVALAVALTFNLVAPLQRWVPSYTASLQHAIEESPSTLAELRGLAHPGAEVGQLSTCEAAASQSSVPGLSHCGIAPEFQGITAWLNTPDRRALTLAQLHGQVVLVDFWTYSCINCQRTLPHVEAWYHRYHRLGFTVIGVEAPEFAFEHSVSNIAAASSALGVHYPVAVDDNLATWSAYTNEYWPAEYLIDAHGVIRHVAYGEGSYSESEAAIRALLVEAHPHLRLPKVTGVPDLTPTSPISPETYLGSDRSQYYVGGAMSPGRATYQFAGTAPSAGYYDLAGTWTTTNESITAGRGAALTLDFKATHVYLVLAGTGTVSVTYDGRALPPVHVRGFPTLYTLVPGPNWRSGLLALHFTPGLSAYDFTFG